MQTFERSTFCVGYSISHFFLMTIICLLKIFENSNIKTGNKHKKMTLTDKDKMEEEWKPLLLCYRQQDASLITLTSHICYPMITFDLLMTYNWLMVININQWPAGIDILDL